MDSPPKLRYEIDLTRPVREFASVATNIRPISQDDRYGLAQLMFDAYIGTIDYEEETLQDAIEEVESYLAGSPMLEHSVVASVEGEIASAVLVSLWRGRPLIGYVMTAPAYKNRGLGRLVVATAVSSLRRAGHTQLTLFVTQGNAPSEALFAALGAVCVPNE